MQSQVLVFLFVCFSFSVFVTFVCFRGPIFLRTLFISSYSYPTNIVYTDSSVPIFTSEFYDKLRCTMHDALLLPFPWMIHRYVTCLVRFPCRSRRLIRRRWDDKKLDFRDWLVRLVAVSV